MKSFGEIIKTERENKGLILRKVASALDIDQAIVCKFERGDRLQSKVHEGLLSVKKYPDCIFQ
jgi:ribosome-binding protein aMBF1 (putative translation factor)